jgi:amidase
VLQVIYGNDNVDDPPFAAPSPAPVPRCYNIVKALKNSSDLSSVRVGILAEGMNQPSVEARVKTRVEAAVQGIRDLSATVENVSVPFHSQGAGVWTAISKVGGYLSKRNMAFGRRGCVSNDLQERFQVLLTQEQWDQGYVPSKNIYLTCAYGRRTCPGLPGRGQ